MRVPVQARIGSHIISIRYVREIDDNAYAEFSRDERVLRISKTRNESAEAVWLCVWHELAHGALWYSGWNHCLTEAQEEAVVSAIEHALGPLMLLNPKAPGVRWREVAFPFETD